MERRDFLRGMFISASAGTALIKLANPDEVQALVRDKPVILGHPLKASLPSNITGPELFIRVSTGFIPIGYVTSVEKTGERGHNFERVNREGPDWRGTAEFMRNPAVGTILFEGSE